MSAGAGEPVRVAVIGCGLVAQRSHLPAYVESDEAVLEAVVSRRVDTARDVAERFGAPRVLSSWREAIDDPRVEAVDICTPNALHAPIAIAAARAGKHVIVEKPMAVSLQEADAMIEAARESGVRLMVAHNLRFVPIYEQIRQLVAAGTIGRPVSARGIFMHAGPDEFWGATSDWFWQRDGAGGGALLDMGIHMIDLLRWFLDRPVLEVAAMTARVRKPTFADDNAFVLLRFAGDILAGVQASWTARPVPDRQVMIHGERGHIAMGLSAAEPLVVHLQDDRGESRSVQPVPSESELGNPFAHFVRCVRDGSRPLTDGEEGRASLAVALAAYEAARAGSTIGIS